jgi:hypothetical protein
VDVEKVREGTFLGLRWLRLRSDIGLCLFRVLQEATHNAVKYSEAKRVQVQLREKSGEIHLIILDSGKGFDVEGASQGKGLGLTSMRERARLLNGTISIESKPTSGTTIHVRVPLESKHAAKREAGWFHACGWVRALERELVLDLQSRYEHLMLVDTLGNFPIDKLGGNLTRQSSADKPLALTNRLHSG